MRLKKIRLAGFKSFVDPTNIPLPDDMTAIVGPNGCGKSNVIDAVRWVLGESSAKNLRGDAMVDVIFNGSSSRKPVSQCSVELVFDNASQRIQGEYASYNEISVKRLVTRDAQSTYFLNNTRCRKRDVTDLFMGTGLGPRSYAIIEQGMISRLIESKPHELRVFIEEAAGVSKYKERRKETENRIRHTRDNLDRLGDVRTELGQQLEKLQRQAAAAKRYTELKARERTYKGQLAAIRWLKHSDTIAQLGSQIQTQNTEIEAYIAKQRGDEKELTQLKAQQTELKQQISDSQQQFYLVGNEITRLEQNKVFRLQREAQINEELRTSESLAADLEERLTGAAEQEALLQAQLESLEPEQMVLEAQLMEAEDKLADLQEQWLTQQQAWRVKDQQFTHLKQQAQSRHSKIQGLLQVQLRTEQRIKELNAQLDGDREPQWLDDLAQAIEHKAILSSALADKNEDWRRLKEQKSAQQNQLHRQKQALQAKQKDRHKLESQVESLQTLYQRQFGTSPEVKAWSEEQGNTQSLWQYLNVDEHWRFAVETALQQWRNTQVMGSVQVSKIPQGLKLFFTDEMDTYKPPGSLAQKCDNQKVPEWLSRIEVVGSVEIALQRRLTLNKGFSFITQQGEWVGEDWIISGLDASHVSPLEQKHEIDSLQDAFNAAESALQQAVTECQSSEQALTQLTIQLQEAELAVQSARLEVQHLDKQIQMLDSQARQYEEQSARLQEERSQQEVQLDEEKMQLETLAMEVEELEMQIAELAENHGDIEHQRHHQEEQIENSRQAVESAKSRQHGIALSLQDLTFQLNAIQSSVALGQQEKVKTHARLKQLQEELQELMLPGAGQQEKLDRLLQEKEAIVAAQLAFNQQLQSLDESLAESEKGQVGVQQQVEKMRAHVQSLQLESERNRTRANTFVEQLQDMQQSLKHILENLPEEYNEESWRTELEKTSSTLVRLGAVNLAAVEEFEVQSERKKHLDTQNDDLEAALETLENAIRKIDKETKTRFKETFERVNEDVKMLFPKVFGGGAAWLELTGDDLLETGVTIMARPPGKKNSTIHLLSGGEKALTALSLVFAIFRLNPAPFCLLDEVDAPLDDANVGRFCKLVSEMSKTVQFIFITHNKIAMEMAYHLTGVTMAEPGVSRIVAVDVEEAVAIANA